MTAGASPASPAKVVARGEHLSLLVEAPVLGDRKASRIRLALDGSTYRGIGVSLDAGAVLVVIDMPAASASYEVGSTVAITDIVALEANIAFEHARERLLSVLHVESLGSLSDRAARHALLYILEARDADVRRARLKALKTALGAETP